MQLPFTKMHGLGNDFVVLDLISHPVKLSAEQIKKMADRHFGIGFDQMLLIEPPSRPDVDFNYRIYNSDGSEVEHCGNGARCFARFVLDKGLTARNPIRVKTVNRILTLNVETDGLVTVDMGTPDFSPASLPFNDSQMPLYQRTVFVGDTVNGSPQTVSFRVVSVGNPHAVIIVDDLDTTPVQAIGTALGSHPDFPKGVNVGFMQILDKDTFKLRVYERGAGETVACGTGACAAMVTARAAGLLNAEALGHLSGGDLRLSWAGEGQPIIMRGPATTVFEGSVDTREL
ncbi:MAG: diaminopimelate epimerase [Pseudomonadota bacterium]